MDEYAGLPEPSKERPERLREMINMYRAGIPPVAIAKTYELSTAQVNQILRKELAKRLADEDPRQIGFELMAELLLKRQDLQAHIDGLVDSGLTMPQAWTLSIRTLNDQGRLVRCFMPDTGAVRDQGDIPPQGAANGKAAFVNGETKAQTKPLRTYDKQPKSDQVGRARAAGSADQIEA